MNKNILVADVPFQLVTTGETFPKTFSGVDMYDIAAQAVLYEEQYPYLEIFENWRIDNEEYFKGVKQ